MATNGNKLSKTPPKYLKSFARSQWSKLMPLIGDQLQEADRPLIESYCFNYQLLREAYDDIQENGIQYSLYKIIMTPKGDIIDPHHFEGLKNNPATKTLSDATAKLDSLGKQLGLSPQSRAELAKLPDNSSDNVSIADLLSGGDKDGF